MFLNLGLSLGAKGLIAAAQQSSVYATAVNALSPVAYWRLGESAGASIAVDETGNHNASYTGSPTFSQTSLLPLETENTGVRFPLDGDTLLNTTIDKTIWSTGGSLVFLAKPHSKGLRPYARYATFGTSNGDMFVYTSPNDNGIYFTKIGGADQTIVPPSEYNLEDTYHIAVTISSSGDINGYANGMHAFTALGYAIPVVNNGMSFAGDNWGGFEYLDVTMDEISIFNTVLTQQQVTDLYTATGLSPYATAVNALNPVAYWRLGESSGSGTAVDETGTYDGTYVGSPTLETTGLLVGDSDTCVNLNGSTDHISIPVINSGTQGSISAIIQTTNASSNQVILASTEGATSNNIITFYTSVAGGGRLRFYVISAGGAFTYSEANTIVTDGQPHHVVVTSGATNWKFYVDGVLQGLTGTWGDSGKAGNWFGDIATLNDTGIGGYKTNNAYTNHLNGTIDEVSVFNTELTQQQVTDLYNATGL